jgi:iron(III) transport system permease protein
LADEPIRSAVATVQRVFLAGNDLGPFGGPGAFGVSANGGGVQIHGPFLGRIGDDVRCQHLADLSPRNFALADADGRLGDAHPVRPHLGIFRDTSEIYLALNEYPPDYGRGGALAVGLLLLSAVGVWLYTRATKEGKKFQTVTGKAFRPRQFDLGTWRWAGFGFLSGYFLFVVLLPFLVLFWASFLPFFAAPSWDAVSKLSLDNYRYLGGFRPFWDAMQNSIILSTLTATVAMVLTSLVAWIVYKSRLPGSWILDFLAFVPITIPGIVMGMALILLYVAFPIPIYGTIWVLLIAYVTRFIPYGMRAASGSILQIHSELEEAAAASGASWWESFKRVTLPLLRPGLAAGWIYICIVSFREFSTSVLLATGDSRVLSILLFTMFEQGQVTVVAAIGVLMIATLLSIVAVFYKLTGKIGLQT